MDPQLLVAILGSSGLGGLLAIAIKRTWSDRDAVNDAFSRGRDTERADHAKDIADLRRDFTDQIAAVNDHVDRLHLAIADLIPLVAPERMAEAMQIVTRLGASRPIRSNEGETP